MCGPVNDPKAKAAREKFEETLEEGLKETIQSCILASTASPIFDGNQQNISIPETARPRSQRKGKNRRWVN